MDTVNIPHFCFILFGIKIFGEMVTFYQIISICVSDAGYEIF